MDIDASYPYGRNFFVLCTVDEDNMPTDELQTEAPITVMLIKFPGVDEFTAALADGLMSGIPMTMAECAFPWGVVVVHLPQIWDDSDISEDDIKTVISTAEEQFFKMISGGDLLQ